MLKNQTYSADDIRALMEASLGLTSELSLDAVLQNVVDVARTQLRAKYGALSVLDAGGGVARFITSGITEEERQRIGDIPQGHGLLSVLLHSGTVLRLDDLAKDPRSVGFPAHHPEMRSLLGVSIVSRGRIIGNLYLTEKEGGEGFDERDEDLVRLLSSQAAVAVANAELYEAERRRADEWQALFDLSREVTQATELAPLFRSVVERAAALLGAEVTVLALLSGDGSTLRTAAHSGLRRAPTERPRAVADHTLQRIAIETGEPVAISDRHADPALAGKPVGLLEEEDLKAAVAIPLRGKGRILGTLVAGNRSGAGFTDQQVGLLETFGNLTALAIEARELYEKLESLARLEERERIGMDLHDGVIQSIYAVGLHLEDVFDRLPEEPADMKPDVERAIDELNKVIKDIRSYIFDLRPQLSHVSDLPGALGQLVEQFRVNTLITITLDVSEPFEGVGGEAPALALFHIAQEALNNVSKHSKATGVTVRLISGERSVVLEVTDNGIGFDVPLESVPSFHNGLRNMRDRARSVGAHLKYESSPGQGTSVRVTLPVHRKEDGIDGQR
jgi:signal transduction histidine kinase